MAWKPVSQTLRVSLVTSLLLLGQSVSALASPPPPEASLAAADSGDAAQAASSTPLGDGEDVPFLGGFLKKTYIVYPLALDDWRALGEQRYDTEDGGVSVRYARPDEKDGWLDVFFYPVGVLDAQQTQALAASEREGLVEAWKGNIREPKGMPDLAGWRVALPALDDEGSVRTIDGYILDFSYERNGQSGQSVLIHLVHDLYAVKFRYTGADADRSKTAVREDVEKFARRLLPHLVISSTGLCSSPEVIERAGLIVGCVADDAPLPSVDDGMRELRIEYRTPGPAEPQ